MANAQGGIFDFGGGVNMNPGTGAGGASGGGTAGSSYTANNYFPTSGNTSFTGGGNITSPTLPFYNSAYQYNPSTNLTNAFGNLGPYLLNMIQTGGFNPDVLTALQNQLQPQISEGIATIGANTGASGTRFGSGYGIALGDYLGQVNANESAMAAGLYEDSVKNSLSALGIAAPIQAQNVSNQGGFLKTLLSSILPALGKLATGGLSGNGGSGSSSIPTIGTDYNPSPTGSGGVFGTPPGGSSSFPSLPSPTGYGGGNVSDPLGNGLFNF